MTATRKQSSNWPGTALLLFLIGVFCYLLRATDWFRAVPGDIGDARFNSVILEHLYQWVRGDTASLWSPTFFYPARGTLAFSDNHFGTGPVYVLFRFLGLSREHAFDAWFAVGFALNFGAMYVVLRRLRFDSFAAAVGAFVYTFAPPLLAQEVHAQLTYRFALPFAYLAFIQFSETRSAQDLARLVAWVAVQFFCSIYLGVFTGYLLVASAVAMLVPALRPFPASSISMPAMRGGIMRPLVLALMAAVAVAVLLLRYLRISHSYGISRSIAEIMSMLPRPQSYLVADRAEVYRQILETGAQIPARGEHQLFFGFIPILLVLCALLTANNKAPLHRRRLLAFSFATLAILVAATLYVDGHSFYAMLLKVPGISSIRAVSRIGLVMMLPVAIMAAIGAEGLRRNPAPASTAAAAAVVLGLLLETLAYRPGNASIEQWRSRIAPLEQAVAGASLKSGSIVYVTGRSEEPYMMAELDAMIFAQDHRVPTLNGYSGYEPPGYRYAFPCVSPAVRLYSMPRLHFIRFGTTPEEVLARTRWIPLEECPDRHVATDAAAAPPDEQQARAIELDALVTATAPDALNAVLKIHNGGSSTIHTLSRTGNPLRIAWRFVRMPASDDLADPPWDGRQDIYLSIPPGEEASVPVVIHVPRDPGPRELQFSLVAEGDTWLHDLHMPIARIEVPETQGAAGGR
ncbi:hypothetical protein [Variovorax sp. HW608]|uniref:hypothetical protein n=1 Tax=Variovorax sp. HW608 TaxID=1034889 RepID=UPI000B5AC670|nr:hypothetical protein [Variovorax sp. HW608]